MLPLLFTGLKKLIKSILISFENKLASNLAFHSLLLISLVIINFSFELPCCIKLYFPRKQWWN